MFFIEVEGQTQGLYCPVPEDVARAGDAAVAAYVRDNPDKHVSAFTPGAPSAIVEAERAKLWNANELAAEAALAAAPAHTPAAVVPDSPAADEE